MTSAAPQPLLESLAAKASARRRPYWLGRVREILGKLESMPVEILDRSLVQSLFNLERTQATQLMKQMGGQKSGSAFCIWKRDTHLYLYRILRDGHASVATQRVHSVVQELDAARKIHLARAIPVKNYPVAKPGTLAGLPASIVLSKDRLTIDFFGTEDLLSNLYAFSLAVASDTHSIQSLIES